jgi:Ca-activated chloride channel family protein
MPRKNAFRILSLLFTLSLFALSAYAQGVIVPGPCHRCPPRPRPLPQPLPRSLPVKSIKVDAKINGQVATTHVEQIFRNDYDTIMEGTYLFPLPEGASITEFAIWDGDKKLVGEVRSKEEARRIYDEIVRRQRDPGLLEYAGKDLFQASVFPIPPRSDKKLELTYSQVLQADSGTVAYRYPLGTGKNLGQVTGAVAGRVEIEANTPVRNVYSPSHEIDLAAHGGKTTRLSFETRPGGNLNDFQLFYTLSRDEFGLSLLTYREPGKDGYYLLTISPKDELTESEYAAKDIVFVLDTSGSMQEGNKIEQARSALAFGVKGLRNEDRFNIISFAGEERLMETGLIQANAEGRKRGVEFAERLRATGGTNINDALRAALKQFEDKSERPKLLVFMTDGLPTVGETNVARIMDNVRKSRVTGLRLFTFGVGYDVNTELLDKLATENSGTTEYIEPQENLEIAVSNFFNKVNFPVLTDLQLAMGGVETEMVYPRQMPDVFKGSQIVLIGRYRGRNDFQNVALKLSGKMGAQTRNFTYSNLSFPLRNEKYDFLPRLWATRRVGWLMENIRSNGETKELRDEVVDLGTRFGIVTPYTSYLALEANAQVTVTSGDSGIIRGEERQLGNLPGQRRNTGASRPAKPAPSGAGGGYGANQAPAADAVTAKSGAVAVRESKRAKSQQEADKVDDDEIVRVGAKTVKGKTFYHRDGIWTDSEFKTDAKLPETVVEFGSEAYFKLVQAHPELADYLALGEEVVVVDKGRVYRVKAAKP